MTRSSPPTRHPTPRAAATPALSLIAGYQHTRFEGHHWNQGSAGLHYMLSKRTDVYAAYMNDHLSGLSNGNSFGGGLRAKF